jgi:hypothetical protein
MRDCVYVHMWGTCTHAHDFAFNYTFLVFFDHFSGESLEAMYIEYEPQLQRQWNPTF